MSSVRKSARQPDHPWWCSTSECEASTGGEHIGAAAEINLSDTEIVTVRMVRHGDQQPKVEIAYWTWDTVESADTFDEAGPDVLLVLPAGKGRTIVHTIAAAFASAVSPSAKAARVRGDMWEHRAGSMFFAADGGMPQVEPLAVAP